MSCFCRDLFITAKGKIKEFRHPESKNQSHSKHSLQSILIQTILNLKHIISSNLEGSTKLKTPAELKTEKEMATIKPILHIHRQKSCEFKCTTFAQYKAQHVKEGSNYLFTLSNVLSQYLQIKTNS